MLTWASTSKPIQEGCFFFFVLSTSPGKGGFEIGQKLVFPKSYSGHAGVFCCWFVGLVDLKYNVLINRKNVREEVFWLI